MFHFTQLSIDKNDDEQFKQIKQKAMTSKQIGNLYILLFAAKSSFQAISLR